MRDRRSGSVGVSSVSSASSTVAPIGGLKGVARSRLPGRLVGPYRLRYPDERPRAGEGFRGHDDDVARPRIWNDPLREAQSGLGDPPDWNFLKSTKTAVMLYTRSQFQRIAVLWVQNSPNFVDRNRPNRSPLSGRPLDVDPGVGPRCCIDATNPHCIAEKISTPNRPEYGAFVERNPPIGRTRSRRSIAPYVIVRSVSMRRIT